MKMKLSGILVPLATPFEDEQFSASRMSRNIKSLDAAGINGYVLLGSTGEAILLSDRERLLVVETAIHYMPPNVHRIVGCMYESLHQSVDYLKKCAGIGATAALVLPPHYYGAQMSAKALEYYYLNLADKAGLPVILYHFPKISGIELDTALILKLAEHPRIVGIKDSSANISLQQALLAGRSRHFSVLTGSANTLAVSLAMGADGGIVALANLLPEECVRIYKLVKKGKWEEAKQLQLQVLRINQLVTSVYGIGGLKYAMDRTGFIGGLPRPPLFVPDESGKAAIDAELQKLKRIPGE